MAIILKCDVCGKKVGMKDYWLLCKKCQPAWRKGRMRAKQELMAAIAKVFEEIK